jgi:vacuolar-type H+-ATPase subunit H
VSNLATRNNIGFLWHIIPLIGKPYIVSRCIFNMATRKDAKEETATTSPTQLQLEQQQAVYKTLDETRDEIRRSVSEARKEIPRVTEAMSEYQQKTIEAAREIADNYIESQKEIINSVQSAWSPLLENFNRTNWNTVFSPGRVSEIYANIVSSYAENLVTATKLANNVMFANMETFRTSIQQVKDSVRDLSKVGVNAARAFEHTSVETVRLRNTSRNSQ